MLILECVDLFFSKTSNYLWTYILIVIMIGGGVFFSIYSKFIPFRYFFHSIKILSGKYDDNNDLGHVSHFQALSSALAGTIGMGNIAGVAIAIHQGGPGAIFWMWISAILGMSTKFFTCSLSILYRGVDDNNVIQGGPMYYISIGLGQISKNLYFQYFVKFLANLFCLAGIFGCLSLFQANQLSQIFSDRVLLHSYFFQENILIGKLLFGIALSILTSVFIFGGIKKIAAIASKIVPFMVIMYILLSLYIIFQNFSEIPTYIYMIFNEALSSSSLEGGLMGSVIVIGLRRAAFSNEAGIGTEAMAHGAAKTNEPIREGLVAMIGPFIDTIIICTLTALMILSTGVYHNTESNGILLVADAFSTRFPYFGNLILLVIIFSFSITTIISYSYYGAKCTSFLFGTKWKTMYRKFYVVSIIISSIISIELLINFLDTMFALMAIPTMITTILLAPKVIRESKIYFDKLNSQ